MKKTPAILITILALTTLLGLSSLAFFTSQTESPFISIGTGILNVTMKLEDAPEADISGLTSGNHSWIPGDHREALLTIKNTGTLPARWRLGVVAVGSTDPVLADNTIVSWYKTDGLAWKLVKSQRLQDVLASGSEDHWLYDQVLFPANFQPLALGDEQQLVLQVDFELSAPEALQNKEFKGKLVLQGAQVTGEGWFPVDSIALTVEGPNS